MTDNEINIAIAKACGWWGIEQEGMMRPPLSTSEYKMVPDYCHDLNAMHEAEMSCLDPRNDRQMRDYYTHLVQKQDRDGGKVAEFGIFMATAHQRAEAFLRVKGLWK